MKSDFSKLFAEDLRQARKAGYTQIQVAALLNVSQSFVSQLANGRAQPTAQLLSTFARIFKIPEKRESLLFEIAGIERQIRSVTAILMASGTCAGKTHLSTKLRQLCPANVEFFETDWFYRDDQTVQTLPHRYDDPLAIDWDAVGLALESIRMGRPTEVPDYSYAENRRVGSKLFRPSPVVFVLGLHALSDHLKFDDPKLRVWIDCPDDVRLYRRLFRDGGKHKKLPQEKILAQWKRDVRPAYEKFVLPTRHTADIFLNNCGDDANIIPPSAHVLAVYVDAMQSTVMASKAPPGDASR